MEQPNKDKKHDVSKEHHHPVPPPPVFHEIIKLVEKVAKLEERVKQLELK